MLTRVNSIKRPTLPQLRKSIRVTFGNNNGAYEKSEYIHESFFTGDNYHSILKCLDGGYHVLTDQLESMQEYNTLLKTFIESLNSYSNKRKSKLKHQSTISSYNTTKQSQMELLNSPVLFGELIQTRCDAIDQVISNFRKQIDRLYPSERFGTVHKHYRTDSMKKRFKDAHAPVIKTSKLLDEVREEKKKVEKSLREARIEQQNLELDETTSKSKLMKVNERIERKQRESQDVDEKLIEVEEDLTEKEKVYREKAIEIYEKCREYEGERLNLIRETSIHFIHAVHSAEYSSDLDATYGKLLATIEAQQNTRADLDFWAETYHVMDNETTENNTTVELEEEQPITTTTTTKTKRK